MCASESDLIFDANECAQAAAFLGYAYEESANDGLSTSICNLCEGCEPMYARLTTTHGRMASFICRNRRKLPFQKIIFV